MLKRRVGGAIVVENGLAVQTQRFRTVRPLGKPEICASYLDRWGVDEIILIDKRCTKIGNPISPSLVRDVAAASMAPLTVIGGLNTLTGVDAVFNSGADKVGFNNAALHNASLLEAVGRRYGVQSVICSIDFTHSEGRCQVFDHVLGVPTGLRVADHALRLEQAGAGELFLNSVDNDGMGNGFDEDVINEVCQSVSIPVVACGGAGTPTHFKDAFERTSVSGLVAANVFNFYEHSVLLVKQSLQHSGANIRLDGYDHYKSGNIGRNGRLEKYEEAALEELFYEAIKEERI